MSHHEVDLAKGGENWAKVLKSLKFDKTSLLGIGQSLRDTEGFDLSERDSPRNEEHWVDLWVLGPSARALTCGHGLTEGGQEIVAAC